MTPNRKYYCKFIMSQAVCRLCYIHSHLIFLMALGDSSQSSVLRRRQLRLRQLQPLTRGLTSSWALTLHTNRMLSGGPEGPGSVVHIRSLVVRVPWDVDDTVMEKGSQVSQVVGQSCFHSRKQWSGWRWRVMRQPLAPNSHGRRLTFHALASHSDVLISVSLSALERNTLLPS